ncbi:Cell surface protein [Oopsacas minuta]|uniref:Cell surface protein n=1 Tax=Oopsacas minuta TaxID=111878 RepID=A0AAV7JEP9_9METZ|nr:Cell surface protein [Oopsacas minuta]
MSECEEYTKSFTSVRNQIIENFEYIFRLLVGRREDILRQLQSLQISYESKLDSKLQTMKELEDMRKQMAAMYIHQNRAAQVQEAALLPINKEIQAIKLTLDEYKIDFKLDLNTFEYSICNLGEIVESEYSSLDVVPKVPPRTNISRSNSPSCNSPGEYLSTSAIEDNTFLRPNIKRAISIPNHSGSRKRISDRGKVDLCTVIPRVVSSPQICEKPQLSYSFPFNKRKKPIFATCERGYESEELQSPMGLVYHPRYDCIYVVDQVLRKVLVLSSKGDFLMEFGHDFLVKPISIAVRDGFCCITDEGLNGVVKYKLFENLLTKDIASFPQGSGHGELSGPKGLDFDSNFCIYIADSGNNRVCILDPNMIFLKGIFEGIFQSPQDVKIINEIIYVLDRSSLNCLHSFTQSCNPVQSVISPKNDVNSPSFFCSDFTGKYLFFTDQITDNVKVFSLDGDPICKVGENTIEWEAGVIEPTGVCVTKDNKVVCAFGKGESVICFY